MWDLLVLTAGSTQQKQNFEKILKTLKNLQSFTRNVLVIADEPENFVIGSGGSTLVVLRQIIKEWHDKKVLLCHSGGFSKRMIHLSPIGKVFARLPNGKTVLETKLEHYSKNLVKNLPNGLMITASDVLEDMRQISQKFENNSEVIIFAHQSSLEVGTGHGVFCLDDNSQLIRVLQKPTINQMKNEGAVRPDGTVLTDSCFWISWAVCSLIETTSIYPVAEELCCYGDFMRSMGSNPDLGYLKGSKQRQIFANIFGKIEKINIVDLGPSTFFHFGTYTEFLEHLSTGSKFQQCFGVGKFENFEFSKIPGNLKIPETSFLSGVLVDDDNNAQIPRNSVVVTYPLRDNLGYVTVIFDTSFDFKSAWNIQQFSAHPTRQESFISAKKRGKYSLRDLVQLHDIDQHLSWIKNFEKRDI